jgi:AbrB family looped-hinge helix DNA binding protein
MKTTIDKAGRVVVPKVLRDEVGLTAGEVDIVVDGAGLRIEVQPRARLVEEDGVLIVAGAGENLTDEMLDRLRRADQK